MEKELKDKSVKAYTDAIKRLKKKGIDLDEEVDLKKILIKLADMSLSYKRSNLSAIKRYLEEKNDDEYKEICNKIEKIVNDLNEEARRLKEIKDEEKELSIRWEKCLKIQNDMKNNENDFKNKEEHRRFVIISLYTLFPVRDNESYYLMDVIKTLRTKMDDEGKNYYIMSKNKFVFNKYKTKYGGTQTFDVPEELSNILKNYILHNKIEGSLLELDDNAFKYQVKKIFKDNYDENKNITVNTLKESYLDYLKRKKIIESEKQMNDIKNKMGVLVE